MSARKILLVEPDFVMARATARALRPNEVSVVASASEALAQLEAEVPDVVVLDPLLPEGGGVDLLLALATRYRGVRVVVYTTSAEAERRGAFGTAHATLHKPAEDATLRQAVLGTYDTSELRPVRGRAS